MMQQMQQVRVIPNPIMKQSILQQSANSIGPTVISGSCGIPQQMSLNIQPSSASQIGNLPMNVLPPQPSQAPPTPSTAITQNDYKFIFDNTSVGMAIASLGGAFIDCNPIFCQLSEYTKEEVCAMTIFNMTSRQDLQHAFDLISQMITPAPENSLEKGDDKSSIVLRGAMKKRSDLGLNISLIKGDHGIVKCFCVTLIRILSIKAMRPDTVSIEMELPQVCYTKQQKNVGLGSSPAYTAG
jgi:PAS domain-containing protein